MKKTLGGQRLGSGNKMQVELHGYERSTHDLGYLWRTTVAPGTLVPFLSEVALPGDTFDINLGLAMNTHPTLGPLFGSFKAQCDVFLAPIRLYNAQLHNNKLGIGLNMQNVTLPQMQFTTYAIESTTTDVDNASIHPSCLLSYLGLRGTGDGLSMREFNAVPTLAYWEIYKQYYANKMEEIGAVVHTTFQNIVATISEVKTYGTNVIPHVSSSHVSYTLTAGATISFSYSGTAPIPYQVIIGTDLGEFTSEQLFRDWTPFSGYIQGILRFEKYGPIIINYWRYVTKNDIVGEQRPEIITFPLSDIDQMREDILSAGSTPVVIGPLSTTHLEPYKYLYQLQAIERPNIMNNQEGLGIKTYQSDLLNNWLQTEWIDGTTGINEVTAIDVSDGKLYMDTLILQNKVYNILNRIAVSGGSYDDWLDAVWTHDRYTRCESPVYCGGLIKELVFQEVVSNSQDLNQPLGTLAGKGVMSNKHKGGSITIKVDEPSYIIGIFSLTPRVDYSQGNKWDVNLKTLDDLHKPGLSQIGFQELITEQMAWWDTTWNQTDMVWEQKSAGKQPAWINYMTNINQVRGNFAIQNNEMFMTLNRRYERNPSTKSIKDLTTYIDPTKYNQIFAQTSLDAQNFWVQLAVDITARRKMSAKVMPNL